MPLTGPFFNGSFYAYLPAGEPASTNYYVNDDSLAGDQYCTAVGDDANDGLTPGAPKRSVQAIIDRYTLKAGDTVWIDAGLYALTNDVLLTQLDRGDSNSPIRFVGVLASNGEPATVFDRGTNGGACFNLNTGARFIQLESFWLRGGENGVTFDGWLDEGIDGLTIKNTRISNTAGDAVYLDDVVGVDLVNCRIEQFGGYGIQVYGSSAVLSLSTIAAAANRTAAFVYEGGGYYDNVSSLVCSNSILYASGAGAACAMLEGWNYGALVPAWWSCLFATNGAEIGSAYTTGNLLVDPLFADAANGNFHLKSTVGRWDPAASGGVGAFVPDAVDSPCIDAGDPAADVGLGPVPNGGRVNMGAYGGTPYASKSAAPRWVFGLSAPLPGTTNRLGSVLIAWNHSGDGWRPGDTLLGEYSTNNGTAWFPVPGADALGVAAATFSWNTLGLIPSTNYLLRLTCNQKPSVSATSGPFTLLQPVSYYVNDPFTTNDVYCTAAGDDANDGLSPATPKATLQALFDTYDLRSGDRVFVDTGRYESGTGAHLGGTSGGAADGPVVIQGSAQGTVIRCTAAPSFDPRFDNAALSCAAPFVEFRNLTIADSGLGLELSSNSGGAVVRNCLFLRNQYGVELIGSPSGADVVNCTFVGNTNAVYAYYADLLTVRQCIFDIRGLGSHGIFILQNEASLVYSDYNDLYTMDGGDVGFYFDDKATLADWQAITGKDALSLARDPLFVDRANGDFHLQSMGGSWHAGAFTADLLNSPCLDAGDPSASVEAEPAPNGARINLGADGGTAQASLTPPGRVLTILSPNGGEIWSGSRDILWNATGQGWAPGDTVTIEYSSDGGANWTVLASALPFSAGKITWDTTAAPSGATCRVLVTSDVDPRAQAVSDGNFTIHNTGLSFYVNDASTADDVYCTAPGDDANDGLSPATPKATVQALLSAHSLQAGDTVFVDTGYYLLTTTILVTGVHSGSSNAYVRIVGSTNASGSVFDRGNTGSGTACFEFADSDFVSLENVECKGGYDGVLVDEYNRTYRFRSLYVHGNSNWGIEAPNNLYNGQYASLYAWNCLVVSNAAGGIYTRSHLVCSNSTIVCNGSPNTDGGQIGGAGLTVRNCIVGATAAAGILFSGWPPVSSDYNDFFTANGAVVGAATPDLSAWQAVTGQDAHTLSADPLFVNPAAGDYHLQSTGGSWHGGAFAADPANSPCIDAGDPAAPLGEEPAPNGARINLGAYGGTAQASKTPPIRVLTLVSPNGGEVWHGTNSIVWLATGQAWSSNDTLRLEYSTDGGTSWRPIEGASALPCTTGQFPWDTTTVDSGVRCRVRATCNQDLAVADASDANFTIHNTGLNFYVNDASTTNDIYCTAAGDDSNDGLSPATPKATVQALLSAHNLHPGDTVFVDTGYYALAMNILVTNAHNGSSNAYVRIVGSINGSGSVFDRGDTGPGTACFEFADSDFVSLENMECRGGYDGVLVDEYNRTYRFRSLYIHDNGNWGLEAPNNLYNGQYASLYAWNCLVVSNAVGGIYTRSHLVCSNSTIAYNGPSNPSGGQIGLTYRASITVRDCILGATAAASRLFYDVASDLPTAASSDYNDFFTANGAVVSDAAPDLSTWQATTGQDAHSLSADPLFVNPAAGDYHLQSAGGSWHAGAFAADPANSPCIDVGDPAAPVGEEPAPNGARINLEAYGGTAQASMTPVIRVLTLISPNRGEVYRGIQPIRWDLRGLAWGPADTVTLYLSADSATNWTLIPGGAGILAAQAQFSWPLYYLAVGSHYRVRIVCDQDASVSSPSAGDFSVQAGGAYFVNGGYDPLNNQFCTAAGSDLNDGLTPATPQSSLGGILESYSLEPGDTIFMDAGIYNLTNDVSVTSAVGGSIAAPVRVVGVKGKTVLDRGAASANGTSCLIVGTPYVSVENLTCRNAYYGIRVTAGNCSLSNNTIVGCGYHAIYVDQSGYVAQPANVFLSRNVVVHSGLGAAINLQATYEGEGDYNSLSSTLVNNTIVATNADGIYTSANGGPQLKNNIVQISGPGHYCISARDITGISSSDYNDLYAWNSAQIGNIYHANAPDLFTWRALSSWDAHSLSVDPMFANATDGDFHLMSAFGRFDPSSGKPPTDPTAWVTDAATSLAIDAGDPADPVGDESPHNGARINLGAFGGTAEASHSSTASRIVNVLSPNGGETWSGFEPIQVRTAGSGFQPGDTLRLEYSADGGTTWQTVPGGGNLPAAQTRFWWDTRGVTNGSNYRVRATASQDTSVQDVSDAPFRIANLVAPVILAQPHSQTVPVGGNVTFSVTVNDTILLNYQWFKNGANIPGATNAAFTLNSITLDDAGAYTVLVANPASSVISDPATLLVLAAPLITAQPAGQTAGLGDSVTFTVTASGTQPLSYFWLKDGVSLLGAPNDRTLTLGNISADDAGGYSVIITNLGGSVTSTVATLTVVVRPPNDNFTNRIVLTGLVFSVTGSNVNATMEPGEPYHFASTGGESVWWTWTAPASGPVAIDTIGSSFDTILAVYTNNTLPTLGRVASDDDSGGNHTSRVSFDATAGTAYQIAVDGYNAASGNITLNVRLLVSTLSAPLRLANGQFQFQLTGPAGSHYIIQASTNLTAWTPITTNVIPSEGVLLIMDPAAANYNERFYRAVSP